MKVVYLTQLHKLEIGEAEKPTIQKSDDVLIRIRTVGVCGSDVHYFVNGRIGSQIVSFPYVVGHECSGEVAAIGDSVSNFKVGDSVLIEPAVSCCDCSQCNAGRFHTCHNLMFLGTPASKTSLGMDGCMREFVVMPERSVFHQPEEFSFEDGALLEPLTIGYYAVEKGEAKPGQTVAVLGSGPIGLSVLMAMKFLKPTAIYNTDLIPARVAVAEKMGATAAFNAEKVDPVAKILEREPEGVDMVFECAGEQDTIDQAIELLKPGGTLVLIGIPEVERISGNIDLLRRKEIRVQNIRRQNECTQKTIDAIQQFKADLSPMKTHTFTPEQSQEAFELVEARADGVIKAFINWE